MKFDDIPDPMKGAIGAFEMLRRFGFASDDIFWHQNETADRTGREPAGMMFAVLRTQGKEFIIRTGVYPHPHEKWSADWTAVMHALQSGAIAPSDLSRCLVGSEAYLCWRKLAAAIRSKGIELPCGDVALLSTTLDAAGPGGVAPENRGN